MTSLTWEQVNSWRLSQHYLLERAKPDALLEVVSKVGGLQAQVMSAAELELWTRIDNLTSDMVKSALWRDRTLIKMWAQRGTLHLIRAQDFPLFASALNSVTGAFFRRPSWLKYHGVTLAELAAIAEGLRAELHDVGMTREKLADVIAAHVGNPKIHERLLSGWGALLKPAAAQGLICFGPSEGQNVTFVQPEAWIGKWTPIEPEAALKELVRRYLSAYGPGTPDDFGHWLGMDESKAKRVFKTLADEIMEVDVEGWKAWALISSIKALEASKPSQVVRLLPNFDPYTIALARHSQYILSKEFKDRVYRPQGWISPVVLIGGRMTGVWEYEKKRSQVIVKIDMFTTPTAAIKRDIEAEVQRLGKFYGLETAIVFS
jgi:hypothetical protein